MAIKVECSSDQGLIGVVRITDVSIEWFQENSNDMETKVMNALADVEYFTEDKDWESDVKEDVARVLKCDTTEIEVVS